MTITYDTKTTKELPYFKGKNVTVFYEINPRIKRHIGTYYEGKFYEGSRYMGEIDSENRCVRFHGKWLFTIDENFDESNQNDLLKILLKLLV